MYIRPKTGHVVRLGCCGAIMGAMARRAAGWGTEAISPLDALAGHLGHRPTPAEATEAAEGLRSLLAALGPQQSNGAAVATSWRSAADYLDSWARAQ
jgi:hypothetical protein